MPNESVAASKKPVTRRRKTEEFSDPFLIQEVKINSSPAQTAFADGFERCDTALRGLSVVLPAVLKNEKEIKTVNDAVDHLLTSALNEIRGEQSRLQKIAEDNGIDGGQLNYTNIAKYQAKITCNKSGLYLQLVRELDKLIELVHALWLLGLIFNDARSALERQWRRKVLSVAAGVETIANRAFTAAQKLKQEQEAVIDENAINVTNHEDANVKDIESASTVPLSS